MSTPNISARGAASNSGAVLIELAERAGRHYGRSVEEWFKCANVLLQARELAVHGEWADFLAHADIPRSTAARMLRLARVGVQMCHVTHLGIRRVDGLICYLRRVFDDAIGDCRERYEAWLDQGRSDHDWRQWNLTPDELDAKFPGTARALVVLLAGRPDGIEIADRIIGGRADV